MAKLNNKHNNKINNEFNKKDRILYTFYKNKLKEFYVKDISKDFHTNLGFIESKDLIKEGIIKSSKNVDFYSISLDFIDLYKRLKREAQIIPLKDIGQIITTTGLNKKSRIIDAGSGSGALAIFLANIVKKVYTYEIREDFYEVVKGNIKTFRERFNIKNIELIKGDAYRGFKQKKVDVIVLDLPSPWKAINSIRRSLKLGGFLVIYNPSIVQISDFDNSIDNSFVRLKVIESIEREWEVEGRKIRPKTTPIGHSGFMAFYRRVKD